VEFSGLIVERISGMGLEEYLNKYMCGAGNMTFFPNSDPKGFVKLADMSLRTGVMTAMDVAQDQNGILGHRRNCSE
jgi:hypothetical protein